MTTLALPSGLTWRLLASGLVQTLGLLALRLLLIAVGLFVVPMALPWCNTNQSTRTPFTEALGDWLLITLPGWAWLWSNDRDGAAGDKRGWWHTHAPFALGAYHWLSQLLWLAYRNPANNARFTRLMGCPVTECDMQFWGDETVEDDPGKGGMRLLVATHRETARRYVGFYWVHEWPSLAVWLGTRPALVAAISAAARWEWAMTFTTWLLTPNLRALVVQIGFKGEPSDWAEDYSADLLRQWKGFTFETNPFKGIGASLIV
ncbi:hypothetical protein NA655_04380 [Pseudomonas kuykendallii]|uniref:Uncharacterized protein n=1 Tax=Pseudomonas kuykendallii TaxID=1007099 RepID=A0A1H3DJD2_9PSED|nr:hypothetical protein [Pseudomonas kuykendallii]MCQ4270255.1 hypothetical protein [Pseudomonas kuykendallii]SDX66622.1 hypothetical protein SAMN05216287_3454 [Pseudomonas kuykendallii]